MQNFSKVFSAAMGVSAGMVGSYAIYEQFKDAGNYGGAWLFLSLLVGVFGFEGKMYANKIMKRKKRDIEILTKDIEYFYGSVYRK